MKTPVMRFVLAAFAACAATAALAGGPIYTYDPVNRIPYAWTMSSWSDGKVDVYTDLGDLGILSNRQASQLVLNAVNQWSNVPTTSFRAKVAGDFSAVGLGDITGVGIWDIVGAYNGGGIFVVYDDDGSIFEEVFGFSATGILGVTSIDFVDDTSPEILEAWVILSGPGIRAEDPTGAGYAGVVTHEFGHALNLGHSQANGAVNNPSTLDSPWPSGCPAPWQGTVDPRQVETMYPFSDPTIKGTGAYQATVDRIDDMSAISDLYPAAGYPGTRGIIKGEVRDPDGVPVTGVNVIARNVADPFNDVSSYITGQVSKGEDGPDGSFRFTGLTPGASYVIYVDALLNGAFAAPSPVLLPGPEELWNGAMEGPDATTDDRCAWTTINASAGAPKTVDITFNRYPGAPKLLVAPDTGDATDITPDGSIVVGLNAAAREVFRWNLDTNDYEILGGIVSGQAAISDNGSRIAANIRNDRDGILYPAIYENGEWTALPTVAGAQPCSNTELGFTYGSTYDISGDGSTVVGLSYGPAGCYSGTTRGFKWTAAGGTVQLPKLDAFDHAGRANGVSYDGTVIVGWDDASNGTRRGTQWRNGVASFIKRGNNPVGEAIDVSRDGQYIVGAINGATTGQAWRYRPSSGVEQLGAFGGQTGGATLGISDDYEVIAGFSSNINTGALSPAIWTSSLGFSNLNQLFASQGVNTAGGLIATSNTVSADGRTITGAMASRYGFIPWAIKIPTVIICNYGQTEVASFPQGMNEKLLAGASLGPCACASGAPSDIPAIHGEKPVAGITRMTWTAFPDAVGYDLIRGSLQVLRATGGNFSASVNACLEDGLTASERDELETPAPGDGFWYLVRATNCGGGGTYDSGSPSQITSRDAGLLASPYTCP